VIAFNLLRAAGTLTSRFHARATTATLRAQLINLPARIVKSARRIRLRLPANWPWQHAWHNLFSHALAPPADARPAHAARPTGDRTRKAGQTGSCTTPTARRSNGMINYPDHGTTIGGFGLRRGGNLVGLTCESRRWRLALRYGRPNPFAIR
jgi:hypothetical protein